MNPKYIARMKYHNKFNESKIHYADKIVNKISLTNWLQFLFFFFLFFTSYSLYIFNTIINCSQTPDGFLRFKLLYAIIRNEMTFAFKSRILIAPWWYDTTSRYPNLFRLSGMQPF